MDNKIFLSVNYYCTHLIFKKWENVSLVWKSCFSTVRAIQKSGLFQYVISVASIAEKITLLNAYLHIAKFITGCSCYKLVIDFKSLDHTSYFKKFYWKLTNFHFPFCHLPLEKYWKGLYLYILTNTVKTVKLWKIWKQVKHIRKSCSKVLKIHWRIFIVGILMVTKSRNTRNTSKHFKMFSP